MPRLGAFELHRQLDILAGRERGQQIVELEHNADAIPAQIGELVFGKLVEGDIVHATTAPREGVSMAPMRFSSVVLPHPKGP